MTTPEDKVKGLNQRAERLFNSVERTNNENYWSELSEFMLNNQFNFNNSGTSTLTTNMSSVTSSAPGSKKTNRIYDSTALQAVQDLASSFQGTLTNPATTWSKLRYQTEVLNNNEEAVIWLEEVNKIIHNEFNESNFDTEIAKGYQSLVALANMALFHEQRENEDGTFDGFRFTSLHLGQIAWAEDKEGIVDTVYRKFSLTAKQAFQRWGTAIPDSISRVLEKTPDQEFDFLHCVFPRDAKDIKLNDVGLAQGDKRPIASIYMTVQNTKIVEEGGYYEMPIYVPRWSLMSGEKYGRGPSHLALPDVRTLNQLKMRGLEAIDLQVRPPILANQRDVFGQLDMRPGGLSIVRDVNGVREFVSQARTDVLRFSVEELRNSIRGIFFLDKLLLPPRTETGEMTAFEVSQRVEQMQRVLGPTLSRLNSELLQPLVIRAFKILLRSGELPEAPQILEQEGIDVEIVFVNQLARAQQQQDVSSIQQWVQDIGLLAQLNPSVIDNIDFDGIARHTAKIRGVPEVAITNDGEVEAVREQRAQQAQQQQQIEQANMQADTESKINGGGNNNNE